MQDGASLRDAEPVFRAIIEGGGVFTLHPRGASMRPTIVPGRDSVSVVRLEGEPRRYDILLYRRPNGQFVLHRVARVKKGSYTMCGDNQVVFERGICHSDVVGVVSVIHRPGGDLVRGTRPFVRVAAKRAWNRPLRRVRYLLATLYHRVCGK